MGEYYVLHNHHDIPPTSERFQPPKRRFVLQLSTLVICILLQLCSLAIGVYACWYMPKTCPKTAFSCYIKYIWLYICITVYIYLYDIIARIIILYNIKWFLKKIPHGFNAWAVRFGAVFGSPSGARLRFWSRGSSGETDGISMYIYICTY